MRLGFSQIILIIFVIFLLFGNFKTIKNFFKNIYQRVIDK
jgi:Sec-independent protein translocase protein TatA